MAYGTGQKQNRSPQRPNGFDWRLLLWLPVAFIVITMLAQMAGSGNVQQLSYTQFTQAVQAGKVAAVTLHGQEIKGRYKHPASAHNGGAQQQTNGQQQAKGQQQTGETGANGANGAGGGGGTVGSGRTAGGGMGHTGASTHKRRTDFDFSTTRPQLRGVKLMSLLKKNHVDITVKAAQTPLWQRLLLSLLPILFIIALFIFFSRYMRKRMGNSSQGGIFGLGKSRAKRHRQGSTGVTMNSVAGADTAKGDVQEIIDFLRSPGRYRHLGAEIPRGVLLMGPPGTGKTLMAKAMAGEANVPFYSISGSEFIEMFVGVGASRVRNMFAEARKETGAIIFIDELDAIGRARGMSTGGGHDEREHTLNQILVEMDGFETGETVVVIGATNRPDVLDPALLRPGRFDRKIIIERPHLQARKSILAVHVRDKPMANDVDLDLIARRTAGLSGADLHNLVNEAALCAGRDEKKEVDMACFDTARDKIVLGAPREERLTEQDKKVIAYHECGHALLAHLLPKAEPPDRVTIIPRGQALGATEQNPAEERYNMAESDLRDRIGVLLGGRTAEKMIFGEVSTGAQQDLKQATDLVRKMVSEWGMSEQFGASAFPRSYTQRFLGQEVAQPPNFSEQTAQVMDAEIRRILAEVSDQVTHLLQVHRGQLEALATRLLENETLGRVEIDAVLQAAACTVVRPSA